MTRKPTATSSPRPAALKDPAVKKKLKRLKDEDATLWDEDRLKAEITRTKKQQERLGALLTDLRKIERGTASKKRLSKKTKKG